MGTLWSRPFWDGGRVTVHLETTLSPCVTVSSLVVPDQTVWAEIGGAWDKGLG